MQQLFFVYIFCTDQMGDTNCRRRVRPWRAAAFFQHRLSGGPELPQACSPLTGGEFFTEPQRGDSPSADGGSVAAPAAGAKRKDNLRFSFLFELLPFPCLLARRKSESGDRCEKRERQSGYRCVCFATYSQFTDSVLLHIRFHLRRRDIPVSRNSLVWRLWTAPTNLSI